MALRNEAFIEANAAGARTVARAALLPAAATLAVFLPAYAGLIVLGALGVFVGRRRVAPEMVGRRRATLLLLAFAAGLLAVEMQHRLLRPDAESVGREVGELFEEIWRELEGSAEAGADGIRGMESAETGPLEAFEVLGEEVASRPRGLSLLLVDPDGTAEAWAGEGLLHEMVGPGVPTQGRFFRAGVQAATLAVSQPLSEEERSWRVVAGRTLSAEQLPGPYGRLGTLHWTPISEDPMDGQRLLVLGSLERGPRVVVERESFEAAIRQPLGADTPWRRSAALLVALALLLLALPPGLGAARERRGGGVLAGLGAIAAGSVALGGLPARLLWVLVPIGAFALLSWWRRAKEPDRGLPWWAVTAGMVGGLALLAHGLQAGGPVDLGSGFLGSTTAAATRIVVFLWALGALAWVRRAVLSTGASPGALVAGAFIVGLAAACTIDQPVAAWGATLLAAAFATLWISRRGSGEQASLLLTAVLLAAVLAGASWEAAYRERLREHLGGEVLSSLALPDSSERAGMQRRLQAAFEALDLREVALRDPDELDAQDLALAVWTHSPLRVKGLLSTLVVESYAGAFSVFTFGLPMGDEDLELPEAGRSIPDAVYEASLVAGSAELQLEGTPWGLVRYSALLRPGFREGSVPIRELAEGLLRGVPAAFRPDRDLLGAARYMAYDATGSRLLTSWTDSPPLESLSLGQRAVVELDGRPAWAWAAASEGVTQALFLPRLEPLEAAERVTTFAVGILLVAGAFGFVAAVLQWRLLLSAVRRAFRHYSKRLILVYSLLVLLPILALNGLAVRVLADRLEGEQRAAGRLALESASRILGEYVLALDPGFGLETTLDDSLLNWLSRVVRHEVNLYWGSSVYASSLRELFTAGLLPERIPGEIYSELVAGGQSVAGRTNRAGDTPYLELYGTVAIPGVDAGGPSLVLSLPLLAQEEELAAEIATVRRRAVLLTLVTALLLVAVGARLARTFTEPLMQIIEGTQRIASGAESTGVQPTEEELSVLVAAIDRMAAIIAAGRRELLREKEIVDRIIDHITSAVVSLDRERRVVMVNRVAQRLLQLHVGDSIEGLAEGRPDLKPLAGALEGSIRDGAARTVRLPGAEDDEEEREWTLVWIELEGEGEPSALLVVEDVTQVLRGQRLQAWAEMARIIAHEIKNPLTPIRLSAEHMREVRATRPDQFDDVFERCTSNILTQVGELQLISSEFLTYSRIPRCDPTPGDVVTMARKLVEVYRAAPPDGIQVELESDTDRLIADFDEKLLGRALRNLVENAVRASPAAGRVVISVTTVGSGARISVADQGPGVPPEDLGRIFEPYFSTHDTGTGLGLPIAQRIAEEHGGTVQARNRRPRGLEVSLWIPLQRSAGGPSEPPATS